VIEKTLCIFKPDLAASEAHVREALLRVLAIGLVPVRLARTLLMSDEATELYYEHEDRDYFLPNIAFMMSGPVYIIVFEGESACERLRELIGATDPTKAQRGTLRQIFGTELPRNAVHGSASSADAEREIEIFFEDGR
jgi:nucleoside-diphosphate kinase